jgi:hypothetical protein
VNAIWLASLRIWCRIVSFKSNRMARILGCIDFSDGRDLSQFFGL